jgi:hypothetical protein
MFKNMHMLDHTESVTMTDESSALRRNMPKRNDEEGGKQPHSHSLILPPHHQFRV